MNDVFLAINQRPQQYLDQSPFGVLDLSGRATGGAFHPTAEGHAIIANDATVETLSAHRLRSLISAGSRIKKNRPGEPP
jgi:hypothetical protein